MSKKAKIILVSVFAALMLAALSVVLIFYVQKPNAGTKKFTVSVVSERDGYNYQKEVKSDLDSLGDYLRTWDKCTWEDSTYGIYVHGFDGCMEDMENQYWWNVSVNGESAVTGCDEIMLTDGDKYEFTLMQGW